jgi:hypothetical protein
MSCASQPAGSYPPHLCIALGCMLARTRGLRSWVAVACLLQFLFVSPAVLYASPQSSKPSDTDSWIVRGTVINSTTQAPVPRALIYSADNRFAKFTDDDGRFEFRVPRAQSPQAQESGGSFRNATQPIVTMGMHIGARRPGYFDGSSDLWLDSSSGEPLELRIFLTPEALIVGRVNLPSNDGTDKIQVAIYRRQVQDGSAQWVQAGNVTSRANGDFRFANLHEGDYKLFTEELLDQDPLTLDPRGPRFGYPPVYFPSAADFESAAVIHLKAGQTLAASLSPVRREYHPVKLNVLGASMQGVAVSVEPQAHPGPGYSLGFNQSDSSIQGMLPNGTYSVEVIRYGPEGGSGFLNFSVNGAPVVGPTLAVVPHSAIPVTVHDERTKADGTTVALAGPSPGGPNLLNAFQLRLVTTDEFRRAGAYVAQAPPPAEDGSAQINNVRPGTYRVRSACSPLGYLAAISSGGTDLLQQPLVVGAGASISPLEVTVRDDGAEVDGSIEDWPQPVRRSATSGLHAVRTNTSTVVLSPMPDSTGQFCQTWINTSGDFHFPQVAPGDYRVLAFERLPSDLEYENREAMRQYESQAQELHLAAGQKEHVRLKLIGGRE